MGSAAALHSRKYSRGDLFWYFLLRPQQVPMNLLTECTLVGKEQQGVLGGHLAITLHSTRSEKGGALSPFCQPCRSEASPSVAHFSEKRSKGFELFTSLAEV